jgi:hypothetical protein
VSYPCADFAWNVKSYIEADKAAGYACSSFRIVETDASGNYVSYGSDSMNGMVFSNPSLAIISYNTGETLSPTYGGSVSSSSGTVYSDYQTGNYGTANMDAVTVMKYSMGTMQPYVRDASIDATLKINVTYSVPFNGSFTTHYFVLEHYVGGNSTTLAQSDATTTSVERVPNSLLAITLSESWISVSKKGDYIVQVGYPCANFAWDVQSYIKADKAAGYACSSFRIVETDASGNYVSYGSDSMNGMYFGTPSLSISYSTYAPVFTPGERYISSPTDVTITSSTSEASIYYTTDGTTPSSESALYTKPITVTDGTILKAVVILNGYCPTYTSRYYMAKTIPVVAWHGVPEEMSSVERFKELREAGFTHNLRSYTSSSQVLNALDCALDGGIQLFVNLQESPVSTSVNKFKNHPALAGYLLLDEPGADDFDGLASVVTQVQAIDSEHDC